MRLAYDGAADLILSTQAATRLAGGFRGNSYLTGACFPVALQKRFMLSGGMNAGSREAIASRCRDVDVCPVERPCEKCPLIHHFVRAIGPGFGRIANDHRAHPPEQLPHGPRERPFRPLCGRFVADTLSRSFEWKKL